MKKLLLILLCLPMIGFGQDKQEAINFLNQNARNWNCQDNLVDGQFGDRITINLINDDLLNIKILLDSYLYPMEYYRLEINLDKIIRIYKEENSKKCAGIVLQTTESGITMKMKKFKKREVHTAGSLAENGWISSEIRLINDENFDNRADRLIKALTFLAEEAGAKIKTTSF